MRLVKKLPFRAGRLSRLGSRTISNAVRLLLRTGRRRLKARGRVQQRRSLRLSTKSTSALMMHVTVRLFATHLRPQTRRIFVSQPVCCAPQAGLEVPIPRHAGFACVNMTRVRWGDLGGEHVHHFPRVREEVCCAGHDDRHVGDGRGTGGGGHAAAIGGGPALLKALRATRAKNEGGMIGQDRNTEAATTQRNNRPVRACARGETADLLRPRTVVWLDAPGPGFRQHAAAACPTRAASRAVSSKRGCSGAMTSAPFVP